MTPDKILHQGARGSLVQQLQEQLIQAGFSMVTDGIFGSKTAAVVKQFQKHKGLSADGVVGPATWKAFEQESNTVDDLDSSCITEQDLTEVAQELHIETAAIKAVYEVESRGNGFLPDGRPKILFEGHIFWRQLTKAGLEPNEYLLGNENILHRRWTRDYYREDQYKRLEKAKKIHNDAALASASWGTFQIMGFNYKACDFETVKGFVEAHFLSEREHLKAFTAFLTTNKLIRHLQNKDWANFARHYNGPSYAQNKYDTRLAGAYLKYS